MRTGTDKHGRIWRNDIHVRPYSVLSVDSLLQWVAGEYIAPRAGLHQIALGRPERLSIRPAPVEAHGIAGAGTIQDKRIDHADRVSAIRISSVDTVVLILKFMYAAITIRGNAFDYIIDASLCASIRLGDGVDDCYALT